MKCPNCGYKFDLTPWDWNILFKCNGCLMWWTIEELKKDDG